MIQVRECRTAEEVRVLYREVAERKRVSKLVAHPAAPEPIAISEPEPPPPPAPEPVLPPAPEPPPEPAPEPEPPPPTEPPPPITRLARVMRVGGRHYGVSAAQLRSSKRAHDLTHARAVGMYLMRTASGLSLPIIGRLFARDHSSVLYSLRKIEARLENDPEFASRIEWMLDVVKQQEVP